ncbi:MAG: FAD-dependent oxidoreductase, partial [Deltaproteobacteria bacterium]
IDRDNRQVLVKNLATGQEENLPYDRLVLATGSIPVVPPLLGAGLDGVFTVTDLGKAKAIKERLAKGTVSKAVVLGGGAIGIEMAEALADLWGVETSIVEMMDQLLPGIIDDNVALMAQRHLEENGVTVYSGEKALAIEGVQGKVRRLVTDKRAIDVDLVILAVGVRPNSRLAREAGLQIGPLGGIVVNQRLQTSDPNIYAGGDCVEMTDLISGTQTYAPLGSLANRQGRVIGSNLAGKAESFDGAVGSFIIKIFDNCVAKTGLSLHSARTLGFDAFAAFVVQADKAHFYPDSDLLYMQLIVDRPTQRVLGVQGIGANKEGLFGRIAAVAAILKYKPTIQDISNLEVPYSPPYSSAMDILNTLGNTAQNMVEGRNRVIGQDQFRKRFEEKGANDTVFLDVRAKTQSEPLADAYGESWLCIPQDELKERLDEIPDDKEVILVCNAGGRSFEAQLTLAAAGKNKTLNLPGGIGGLKKSGIIL